MNISSTGSSWMIGVMAVLHFTLVSMGGLAPLLIYLVEGSARKNNNPYLLRMGKEFLSLALEVGVVGGILGSGVVVMLVGLRPQVLTLVVNIFFWFLVLQLLCFIGGLAFQFAYYFTWSKEGSRHRLWGLIGSILPLVPYVVFSAGVSFLNNPGAWPQTGNIWAAVFNPAMLPSLLHRAAAGTALLGTLLMAIHSLRKRGKSGEELEYHQSVVRFASKLVLRALEAQVLIGILRIFVVRPEGQQMLFGGELTWIWFAGIAAGLIAWGILFFRQRSLDTIRGVEVLLLIVIPVLGSVWLMGTTRALERGPFSMVGIMDRQDTVVRLPAGYQVAGQPTGEEIFNQVCAACHPGLAGDAFSLAQKLHPTAPNLAEYLRNPAKIGKSMPPFTGSDAELKVIVAYVLNVPVDTIQLTPQN